MDVALFTVVFLVFMVGSGEQVLPSIRSENRVPEQVCWDAVKKDTEFIEASVEAEKGFKVFILGMCIPEERNI